MLINVAQYSYMWRSAVGTDLKVADLAALALLTNTIIVKSVTKSANSASSGNRSLGIEYSVK